MSKRSAFLCVLFGTLLLAAAVFAWQKPADPPADSKTLQTTSAESAKGSTPAKEAAAKPTGFPAIGESLNYALVWPGGANLGEAHLRTSKTSGGWQSDFTLDASVPGFAVSDRYRSRANADFCSVELEKETTHGARHTHEKTVFDYKTGSATRTTLVEGGGHTDIDINDCARDGLDFVFYAQSEMALGHGVPKEQDVLFGASYSARMLFAGVQDVVVGSKHRQADHVIVYLKGPASDYKLDMFFDRDSARTPLMVKVPLPVGTLSMELVR